MTPTYVRLHAPMVCSLLLPLLLLIALLAIHSPSPTRAAESLPFQVYLPHVVTIGASPEQRVVALTNELRQQYGCPTVQIAPELMTAARAHSEEMADHDYFDHIDLSGHRSAWRLQQAGYLGTASAENIAAGTSTPEQVVEIWSTEMPPNDGHRQNMLNCSFTEIGVGYATNANSVYKTYWTQVFGTR